MDKAERSRVTPRLFTLDAKEIRQPAKTTASLKIPDSTDGFPSTIASLLSLLSLSLFLIVQPLMSSVHEDSLDTERTFDAIFMFCRPSLLVFFLLLVIVFGAILQTCTC